MLLILLLSQFIGLAAAEQAAPELDPVRLQLKWRHQFQFAGYYAALEQGYYREAGLDVAIKEGASELDPVEEVVQGRAEFSIGTSVLAVRRAEGAPVVVLAPIFQHSPYILMASRRAGVESIHDLAGKKVGLEPQAAELLAYMRSEGLSTDGVIVQPNFYEMEPLMKGEMAAMSAYSTDEPYELAQAGFDHMILDPRSSGIDFYGDCLFTSEDQVKRNPQRVRAFLNASLKGWKYALAHSEEVINLILHRYSRRHSREHLQFEADVIRRLVQPDIIDVGYMNPGRWKYIANTYAELGLMPSGFSMDGFLYERNPAVKLLRFYETIAGLALLLVVTGAIGFRFFSLSRRLRWQIRERVKAEQGLRQAEERYRLLVEQAPFPIAINARESGAIRFVNPRAAEIFRVDRNAVLGRSSVEFYVQTEERAALLEALAHGEIVTNHELRLRRGDGDVFWAHMTMSRIVFDGEDALFCAFSDISARKQTEAERNQLIAELQAALAEIQTLSGLIPICCACKRIRDDEGYWQQVEGYITRRTGAQFSHGICPECFKEQYPEYAEEKERRAQQAHAPEHECAHEHCVEPA